MNNGTVQLLIRGDDAGMARSINQAILACYRRGVLRAAEIMAPGPWFPDAVAMLRSERGIDVGIHLTLTSEWDRCRWRPLTAARFVDRDGYLPQTVPQLQQFGPTRTEMLDELRHQVRAVLDHLPWASHLSSHMFAVPIAVLDALALEFNLISERKVILPKPGWVNAHWVEALPASGCYWNGMHPGYDGPELAAMTCREHPRTASVRQKALDDLTSQSTMEAIERRGVELIDYRTIRGQG